MSTHFSAWQVMTMTRQEAAKLLSLIKLSYPTAYRDIDKDTANATVTMWQLSFPDVPYPIMEQAFNHFRMVSKFPPTVAEMVQELRRVYYEATECALLHKELNNPETVNKYRLVMKFTERYSGRDTIGGLSIDRLCLGGEQDAGASRNRLD